MSLIIYKLYNSQNNQEEINPIVTWLTKPCVMKMENHVYSTIGILRDGDSVWSNCYWGGGGCG